MIQWFHNLLYGNGPDGSGSGEEEEHYRILESLAPAQPTGLCVTPHLLGTCNPDFDPAATGVIAGLRPTTTASDLYKGVLEGIACEFAHMNEMLQPVAGVYSDVYLSGGGGRSPLGLQLRAAMAKRKLHLMRCPEAVCLGTAILAGVATGKYKSIASAVEQVVHTSETIAPDPTIAASYQVQREQYQLLYSSLAPLRAAQRPTTGKEE